MDESASAMPTWLDLYDYRRRVAGLYRARNDALQAGHDAGVVWAQFCAAKDRLYAEHPQSPLSGAQRAGFAGLAYFPYNPALCVPAVLEPAPAAEGPVPALPASGPQTMPFRRAARLHFTLDQTPCVLVVYWIDVYGGSLFVPFRDTTSGDATYGGGRYLVDSVKGSDFIPAPAQPSGPASAAGPLGWAGGPVRLDFNYAYNPSCAYDPRWICPLAPPDNRLALPIRAGERWAAP